MSREQTSPTQGELFLPLLEVLRESGGQAKPSEVYQRIADKLGLDGDVTAHAVDTAAGSTRTFDRNVRWAQQRAKLAGFVANPERNLWALTEEGSEALANAKPGVVVTVFESELGVALWAETQSAVSLVESGLVNAIITSPPYALTRKKDYANQYAGREHADWLFERAKEWKRVLADDGSLFLNLGDVFVPGMPVMDLYQERLMIRLCDELGFFLAQRLSWENPSKMPAPAEWVTVRRVRVTPSVEQVWWLSKTPHPKANNRNVLRPYSEAMRQRIAAGGERGGVRPSGHALKQGAFAQDNGGSIPHSLLTFSNTSSNDAYQRFCKDHQLPRHPARFPSELCEWLLKLSTDEGDICLDDFGGSLTFAAVCERLKRRWISCDKSLAYLRGGIGRLTGAAGAKIHLSGAHVRSLQPQLLPT